MNNRIRQLRKTLNLSQKDFAEKIGLKQNAISYMEKIGSTVKEQNIKTICSQFSVNENWLRTGHGKMFLINDKKQKEFFAIFDNLSPALQDYLIKAAKNLLDTQIQMQQNNIEAHIENLSTKNTLTIDERVEDYRRQLEAEEKAGEKSSALPKDA